MADAGKEGHQQMLGQATAVLVSLSTLFTLEISAAGLLAIFHQVLAFASAPHAFLFELIVLILAHVLILVIVDGALAAIRLSHGSHSNAMTQETRWRRWQTSCGRRPGRSRFRHCVPTGRNWHAANRSVSSCFPHCSHYRSDIVIVCRDALASGDSMIRDQGSAGSGVGVIPSVGLW